MVEVRKDDFFAGEIGNFLFFVEQAALELIYIHA